MKAAVLKRAVLILTAVVLATAAPLRAWCEAGCLGPAQAESVPGSSHCQTSEPDADETSMSATIIADCPTVEAARPIGSAKPVFAAAVAPQYPGTSAPRSITTPAPKHHTHARRLPSSPTPLRI